MTSHDLYNSYVIWDWGIYGRCEYQDWGWMLGLQTNGVLESIGKEAVMA
jgi:hypothetical protein